MNTPETLPSLHALRTCAKTVYGAEQLKGCAKDRIRLSKDAPLKPTWRVCSARTIPIVL